MPQFNPESFASQIFWLAICFGLIYFSMSRIFLPRIRDILKQRHHNIDHNESIAFQIQEQIDEIEITTKRLRETSVAQYKIAIDQSVKQANLHKEKDLQNLKNQIAKMVEESKAEIATFKKTSQNDCQKIVNNLVEEIGNKFFAGKIN
jgi:F-type H+-transporting ATPase subunit b